MQHLLEDTLDLAARHAAKWYVAGVHDYDHDTQSPHICRITYGPLLFRDKQFWSTKLVCRVADPLEHRCHKELSRGGIH